MGQQGGPPPPMNDVSSLLAMLVSAWHDEAGRADDAEEVRVVAGAGGASEQGIADVCLTELVQNGRYHLTYLYPCIVSQLLALLSDYLSACLAGL